MRSDCGRMRTAASIKEKKKKTKVTLMNKTGKGKLLNTLLIALACCLVMARRLHVCILDLNFAILGKILLAIMKPFYMNACSSKILTVVVAFN